MRIYRIYSKDKTSLHCSFSCPTNIRIFFPNLKQHFFQTSQINEEYPDGFRWCVNINEFSTYNCFRVAAVAALLNVNYNQSTTALRLLSNFDLGLLLFAIYLPIHIFTI